MNYTSKAVVSTQVRVATLRLNSNRVRYRTCQQNIKHAIRTNTKTCYLWLYRLPWSADGSILVNKQKQKYNRKQNYLQISNNGISVIGEILLMSEIVRRFELQKCNTSQDSVFLLCVKKGWRYLQVSLYIDLYITTSSLLCTGRPEYYDQYFVIYRSGIKQHNYGNIQLLKQI